MIILESALILAGDNVLPENRKIIANWVKYDDVTGQQLAYGTQEIWMEPKDLNGEWEGKPADVSASDRRNWKNLDPQVKAVTDNLFAQIVNVIEDAVTAGDIDDN
jgi:hypothetical protein